MKGWIAIGVMVGLVALGASCAPSHEEQATHEHEAQPQMSSDDAMRDLAARWDSAMNAKDADALTALYVADGGEVMPQDGPAAAGTEELRTFFQDFLAKGDATVSDHVEMTRSSGDLAIGKGTYTLSGTDADGKPMEETGKWLCVARRQPDGSLKMVRNIWNRNELLPGEPAPPAMPESGPAPAVEAPCLDSPTAVDQAFRTNFISRNVAVIAAIHTPDGVRMPPDAPEVTGRDGISAYGQANTDRFPNRDLELTGITEETSGDLGYTRGNYRLSYTPSGGGSPVTQEGKYIAVATRGDDGCWRDLWVQWNRNSKPAQPAS